jgi:DNA-directed RNA polymerase specialized sigma24 family protein
MSLLDSPAGVIRCLVTYADWWQTRSTSVLRLGAGGRSSGHRDGMRAGFIESLDERMELCRRVAQLPERDRRILFLWYVDQLPADDIAEDVGISRRQCFRVRSKAIRAIVDLRDSERVA